MSLDFVEATSKASLFENVNRRNAQWYALSDCEQAGSSNREVYVASNLSAMEQTLYESTPALLNSEDIASEFFELLSGELMAKNTSPGEPAATLPSPVASSRASPSSTGMTSTTYSPPLSATEPSPSMACMPQQQYSPSYPSNPSFTFPSGMFSDSQTYPIPPSAPTTSVYPQTDFHWDGRAQAQPASALRLPPVPPPIDPALVTTNNANVPVSTTSGIKTAKSRVAKPSSTSKKKSTKHRAVKKPVTKTRLSPSSSPSSSSSPDEAEGEKDTGAIVIRDPIERDGLFCCSDTEHVNDNGKVTDRVYAFRHRNGYVRHFRVHHLGMERCQCPNIECGTKFNRISCLQRHLNGKAMCAPAALWRLRQPEGYEFKDSDARILRDMAVEQEKMAQPLWNTGIVSQPGQYAFPNAHAFQQGQFFYPTVVPATTNHAFFDLTQDE